MFLGLVLAAIMLGGTGGIIYYVKTQNGPKDLVETPNVMQKLNESEKKNQKIILVLTVKLRKLRLKKLKFKLIFQYYMSIQRVGEDSN